MRRRWLSKLASGSTCHARCIRGTEHGDARFATASLSDQHADALQETSGYRLANKSTYGSEQDLTVMALDFFGWIDPYRSQRARCAGAAINGRGSRLTVRQRCTSAASLTFLKTGRRSSSTWRPKSEPALDLRSCLTIRGNARSSGAAEKRSASVRALDFKRSRRNSHAPPLNGHPDDFLANQDTGSHQSCSAFAIRLNLSSIAAISFFSVSI
jgi:hypothetical protein